MCLRTVAVVALPVEWGSAGLSQGWVEKPVHVLDVDAGFLAGSPYIHITQKKQKFTSMPPIESSQFMIMNILWDSKYEYLMSYFNLSLVFEENLMIVINKYKSSDSGNLKICKERLQNPPVFVL